MRYDARHRSRNARPGTPPPEPTPAEKAVTTVGLLAVGAWLVAHPTALVLASMALGPVVLLVGLPLVVVRGVVWTRAVVAKWQHDADTATDRATVDATEEASESGDAPAPAE